MQHSIIFFDGVCNLCTGSVKFVIRRDGKDYFRFAPLQSAAARFYLEHEAIDLNAPGTIYLFEKGRLYHRSTAALRIARKLNGGWPLLYAFIIVPVFIRDFFYRQVAISRYSLWGKADSCMVPTAELKEKFLS